MILSGLTAHALGLLRRQAAAPRACSQCLAACKPDKLMQCVRTTAVQHAGSYPAQPAWLSPPRPPARPPGRPPSAQPACSTRGMLLSSLRLPLICFDQLSQRLLQVCLCAVLCAACCARPIHLQGNSRDPKPRTCFALGCSFEVPASPEPHAAGASGSPAPVRLAPHQGSPRARSGASPSDLQQPCPPRSTPRSASPWWWWAA